MSEHEDPNHHRLQAVDATVLTPLVRKSLDQQNLAVTDWAYQQIQGSVGGGVGGTFIYRFGGNARTQDITVEWSLILKILHARPDEDPTSTHYWKREAEFYRSGLDREIPGRLFAANCFAVVEHRDEACWIWQEDVTEAIGPSWSLEHHGLTARHLGQFNGAYMTSHPLPAAPWLGTGWLRRIVQATEPFVQPIHDMLKYPLLRSWLPSNAENQFETLWNERERFLSSLDKLPQTFCHQDPFRRNLFIRSGSDGEYETVAIDWAFVGCAAVGMDIAVPLMINLAFRDVEMSEAQQLASFLYSGYLDGLRDAGWKGDPRQVRLGFTAASVCKYIETLMLCASFGLADPSRHEEWEGFAGRPIQDIMELNGELFRFAFTLADEARALMNTPQ